MKLYIDEDIPPKNPPVISLTNNELTIFRQRRWNRYYRLWEREEKITHYVGEEFMVWKKLNKEFQKLQIDPNNPMEKHPLLNLWKTIDRQWGEIFVEKTTKKERENENF